MAGVKGRSGRRPLRDEEKRIKIIDKAWELVEVKLNSTDTDRFQVARDIVVKDITTKLEGKGLADKRIIIIRPAGATGSIGERFTNQSPTEAGQLPSQ